GTTAIVRVGDGAPSLRRRIPVEREDRGGRSDAG
ncbi:MAG: hypothetical protein QOD73_3144, partial [Solirubrobacteraceae bacterium]|nr:hypothetical protein [Solirubrobacteraceae bacterium]